MGTRELDGAGYGAWLVRTEEEDDGRELGDASECQEPNSTSNRTLINNFFETSEKALFTHTHNLLYHIHIDILHM